MPKRYEEIRDSIIAQMMKKHGHVSEKDRKKAKRIAAATFNKTRKKGEAPVTGKHH